MLRIIASIVFVVYGVFAAYATYEIGYGLYGIPAAILIVVGLFWEVWIQPVRDEEYRQELLKEIEGLKFDGSLKVNNLQDAKDITGDLVDRLHVLSDAYCELKEEVNSSKVPE